MASPKSSASLTGYAAFVTLRRFFRPAFDGLHTVARTLLDPIYDRLGRSRLHLNGKSSSPKKDARHLEEWKTFEIDTFVQSHTLLGIQYRRQSGVMKNRRLAYSWPVLLVSQHSLLHVSPPPA